MTTKRAFLTDIRTTVNTLNYDGIKQCSETLVKFERQQAKLVDGKVVCESRIRCYRLSSYKRANTVQMMINSLVLGTREGKINAFLSEYHMTVCIEDSRLAKNNRVVRDRAQAVADVLGTNYGYTFVDR